LIPAILDTPENGFYSIAYDPHIGDCMNHDHMVALCGEHIDRPGHICAFFDSREQEYQTLVPYFRDGIDAGERVINIVDQSRYEDHVKRLADAGLPVDGDGVNVDTSEATYLEGGRFDMERMCDLVQGILESARASGKRVRTAGVMDWMKRNAPGSERALEYEARMNLLVPAYDCTFMCVYDLANLDGKTVVDLLSTHHFAIFKGQLRRNPFYIAPEVYLKQLITDQPTQTGWA
jgi:hypothetical protein